MAYLKIMMDLLSSFDSFSMSNISCVPLWLSMGVGVFVYLGSSWGLKTVLEVSLLKVFSVAGSLVFGKSGKYISGFLMSLSGVFLLLISLNLVGLFPYSYSVTCQASVGPVMALLMWSCLWVSGLRVSWGQTICVLIPSYAPLVMIPFLMLVEVVTVSLRPITLGLRLMINLTAGHMIISMLAQVNVFLLLLRVGSDVLSFWVVAWGLAFVGSVGLLMAEMAVGVLQAYIFCILLGLYSDEHPS
uniref:ATP synthase subunit a n=1 Tax=Modiolus comptus TaxID=674266 RepID=A0A6M4RDZ0_9BIVA|nr:ATP synthase F0 subunit 6 [Modiolus comptus]